MEWLSCDHWLSNAHSGRNATADQTWIDRSVSVGWSPRDEFEVWQAGHQEVISSHVFRIHSQVQWQRISWHLTVTRICQILVWAMTQNRILDTWLKAIICVRCVKNCVFMQWAVIMLSLTLCYFGMVTFCSHTMENIGFSATNVDVFTIWSASNLILCPTISLGPHLCVVGGSNIHLGKGPC